MKYEVPMNDDIFNDYELCGTLQAVVTTDDCEPKDFDAFLERVKEKGSGALSIQEKLQIGEDEFINGASLSLQVKNGRVRMYVTYKGEWEYYEEVQQELGGYPSYNSKGERVRWYKSDREHFWMPFAAYEFYYAKARFGCLIKNIKCSNAPENWDHNFKTMTEFLEFLDRAKGSESN